MSIFQTVKENVTARQAAEQYGLRISRNGMICCPFHDDRHPSMKVDKGLDVYKRQDLSAVRITCRDRMMYMFLRLRFAVLI